MRCTNCGVIFPARLDLAPEDYEETAVDDKTYKCPVCANFDTYTKEDLFYDRSG